MPCTYDNPPYSGSLPNSGSNHLPSEAGACYVHSITRSDDDHSFLLLRPLFLLLPGQESSAELLEASATVPIVIEATLFHFPARVRPAISGRIGQAAQEAISCWDTAGRMLSLALAEPGTFC